MSGFIDKLALKERAEEDIYFAKLDRELIAALHRSEQTSPKRSNRAGNRPNGNSPVEHNAFVTTVRRYIRKMCPQCRHIVNA